jgi:tetratricopeptide (TPR) repeat protein
MHSIMSTKKNIQSKKLIALLLLLISSSAAFAHATVIDIEKLSGANTAAMYLMLGFTHILPAGLDHILFVLGLFLLNPKLKPVLLQVTAFTIAHTITLGLSVYKIINLPSAIVEPLIALSIVFVAAENIYTTKLKSARLAVVFLFGLIHGMGFASALGETGLPQNRFFTSLLLFNIGVELGQITVILAAWFLMAKWFGNKPYYRKYIVIPASVIIGIVALYWLFTRIEFGKNKTTLVTASFIEQAIKTSNDSAVIKSNSEVEFWKNRIQPGNADYTNNMRYAAALVQRFHLTGDIGDVIKSDSVLLSVIAAFKETESAPFLALSNHAILQHQFNRADSFLTISKKIGLKKYESAAAGFDVSFELGNISYAALQLKNIQKENDYGYQFRRSKLMHYEGAMDSSINAMKAAYELGSASTYLQQAALSNLGDLYIHDNDMQQAAACYTKCIATDKADLHSFTGLAWIALLHDKNDSLAERILNFVAAKTKSPEALFKLVAVAQQRKNTVQELQFAKAFEQAVSDIRYGNMYNKYLVQLYNGVLNNPAKAVTIAAAELQNRNTAQTQAWYAWALYKAGKQNDALKIFTEKISGKPLEALELYWMGKLLKAAGKTSMALQYFNEAAKNKYDLSPAVIDELDELLN